MNGLLIGVIFVVIPIGLIFLWDYLDYRKHRHDIPIWMIMKNSKK